MSKNIVIYSDGTGQAGGLKPDQNLSNIYKLYRVTRTGPDSAIDPKQQIAAYDAGLGTENDEGRIPFRPIQKFRKLWSGSTGTGLSRNIADCYLAIVKHYEPGDRVFLFGFSRGAYTARCVGGVMSLCGIPTHAEGGGPMPRFGAELRKIVDEAVQKVYEHGSGSDDPKHKTERLEQARRFREKYGSANSEGQSNVVPYFIVVFDTVAALGAPGPRRVLMLLGLGGFVAMMVALSASLLSLTPWFTFLATFSWIVAIVVAVLIAGYLKTHIKTIRDFPQKGDFSWHKTVWRFRFYDMSLNTRVRYARHALAIDETRLDFDRVPWADLGKWPDRTGEPEWLRQIWFAGNHSDIGGSYPEDEARLSDTSLKWMIEQAIELPHPLVVDQSRLHLFPDPVGMQHSEIESMRESYPEWWPKRCRWTWAQKHREIKPQAVLHPSVYERFAVGDGVPHYGIHTSYRPANLAGHTKLGQHYAASAAPAGIMQSSLSASSPKAPMNRADF